MQTLLSGGDPAYLLIVVGALFVHSCYQLSVSVLTYISSHSLSRRVTTNRLLSLGLCYSLGVIATTALLLFNLVALTEIVSQGPQLLGLLTAVVAPLVGLVTVLWYYRGGAGTKLWLPRPLADYLLVRSKKTRSNVEAAILGAATVVGELPFIIGPLLFVTAAVVHQPATMWPAWTLGYAALTAVPLIVITMYLTSGHSIARVQIWRETNKDFLQLASGSMLLLLTIYLTVVQLGGAV